MCGSGIGEEILISDYGDGNCSATLLNMDGDSQQKPCDQLLYNKSCGSLNASLTLVAQNNATGTYNGPHWDVWLTSMGLNDINIVGGSLTISLDHDSGGKPIPAPVAPHFLPHLQALTDTLSAFEQGSGLALTSVPGFLSILYAQTAIYFSGTGLRELSGTLRPRCPPTNRIEFHDNPNLVSLAGFEQMQKALPNNDTSCTCTLPFVQMENNTQFGDISSLYTFAGCPSPDPRGETYVEVTHCIAPLQSYVDICNFIANESDCPSLFP